VMAADPVPEPSSIVLLVVAGVMLGIRRHGPKLAAHRA
jgi:hypothetical protein